MQLLIPIPCYYYHSLRIPSELIPDYPIMVREKRRRKLRWGSERHYRFEGGVIET
jgi:hypothetical protein